MSYLQTPISNLKLCLISLNSIDHRHLYELVTRPSGQKHQLATYLFKLLARHINWLLPKQPTKNL